MTGEAWEWVQPFPGAVRRFEIGMPSPTGYYVVKYRTPEGEVRQWLMCHDALELAGNFCEIVTYKPSYVLLYCQSHGGSHTGACGLAHGMPAVYGDDY